MATPTTLPASFTSGQVLTAAQMNNLRGAFRVLQVVTTTKTDTFSSAINATWSANVTGLTATITPSSTSSLILVTGTVNTGESLNAAYAPIRIMRGSTAIGIGATAGSRTPVTSAPLNTADGAGISALPFTFIDSPATTSATTYAIQVYMFGNGTVYVNRSKLDTDTAAYFRPVSNITVMEISA